MKKFKPFSGFCPLPILPASQITATSYAQHLAYLEWYIAQLQAMIEQGGSVVANPEMTGDEPDLTGIQIGDTKYAVPEGGTEYQPEILTVYGLVGDPLTDNETVPVFQGYKFGTKLSVANNKIVIGAGVQHVKISGSASLFYTATPTADTGTLGIKKNGSLAGIQGYAPLPDGASYVMDIEMMPRIIEVTDGDELEPYILNLASGFTTNTVNVYAIVEVID